MDRMDQLKEFLLKDPEDSFLMHALALEFLKIEKLNEARDLFEKILLRDPGYIGSYYHLAKLLERLGQTDLAIHWYESGMTAANKAHDRHAYGELQSALEELKP
jgi:Tfp pilus assembly protein PilF